MLRIIHIQEDEVKPKAKPKKRVPLYKDREFIEALKIKFLKEHNEQFKKKARGTNSGS